MDIFFFMAVDITRNIEIKLILFLNLLSCNHTRIFRYFKLPVEHINNLINILLSQAILIAIFNESLVRINHKDTSATLSILLVDNNNTGWNTSSIKQVGWQTNDTLYKPFSNDIFSYFRFCVSSKKNSMRQNHSTFALILKRTDNVQKKSIISIFSRRYAIPFKSLIKIILRVKAIAPRLGRKWGISYCKVKRFQIAFFVFE